MNEAKMVCFLLLALTVLFSHRCACEGCLRFGCGPLTVKSNDVIHHDNGRFSEGSIAKPDMRKLKTRNLDKIGVEKFRFTDQSGRTRLFHGFNAVEKGPPWYPQYLLNDTRLQFYRDWGFNVVRLGAMWTGFEPHEGEFNETYIDILKDIIQRLKQHGMYVILDMHQDVMSTKFGGYDGIPLWILEKLPQPRHPYPWPLPDHVPWFSDYLTEAVGVAFQGLYDNVGGSLDSMAKFWQKVASIFSDDLFSNVLGYELINEPWAGDIYSKPYLLAPGEAGRLNLAPMYDHLSKAIRLQDDKTLLFYEPVTWGIVFNGNDSGTGFREVPGGPEHRNQSVLSWHYYCWALDMSRQHFKYPSLQRIICDGLLGEKVFNTIQSDLRHLGGASFLTEFGKCDPDGNRQTAATIECEYILNQADQYLTSWAYWDSSFFEEDGNIDWNITLPFARVFARAVSGKPLNMNFDVNNATFYMKYKLNLYIREPTEIFVPKLHFPSGFKVNVTGGLKWTFDKDSQLVLIQQPKSNQDQPEIAEVYITSKR